MDYTSVVKKLENTLKKSFDAKLVNWSCFMNSAFKEKPYNPHVHWKARPRYEKDIKFADIVFKDPKFGNNYSKGKYREWILEDDKLRPILKELQKNL